MQTFLTTIINSRKLTQQLKNSKKIKKRHKVGKKGKLKKSFFFSFSPPRGGRALGTKAPPRGGRALGTKAIIIQSNLHVLIPLVRDHLTHGSTKQGITL